MSRRECGLIPPIEANIQSKVGLVAGLNFAEDQSMTATIALLGAMGEETHLLEAALRHRETRRVAGREFSVGNLLGVPVVTGFSKWGKVAAALSTTLAIEVFGAREVLFLGVAGSFAPEVRVGDVVVGAACLQYDMDISALPGYQKWEIPLLGLKRFPCHPDQARLLNSLGTASSGSGESGLRGRYHCGLIGTGDSFVAETARKQALLAELPDLLAVDMESAAAAQVCHEYQVPFNVVRVISDAADDHAVVDFQRFICDQAAPAVKDLALRYLQARFPQ